MVGVSVFCFLFSNAHCCLAESINLMLLMQAFSFATAGSWGGGASVTNRVAPAALGLNSGLLAIAPMV